MTSRNKEVADKKSTSSERFANASGEFIGGMADALSVGLSKFSESITSDNVHKLGMNNGILKGVFEGYASLFEKVPKVIRNTYDNLTEDKERNKDKNAIS